jgi:ribA/ribD-fused uncharacterized protein
MESGTPGVLAARQASPGTVVTVRCSRSLPVCDHEPITALTGRWQPLSNFHRVPIVVFSAVWPTVEHAFQGLKTFDVGAREQIRAASRPADAKRLGRQVTLRDDWKQVKVDVMRTCLRAKFTQHADLAALLLATGERDIQEGNTWGDTCWGMVDGVGDNRLGRLLAEVRTELAVLARPGR